MLVNREQITALILHQGAMSLQEFINRAEQEISTRGVESAVVHYGDTTLTFLNNLYRADARGTGLTYVSAVAIEEKSVIDYNQGNPDGVLDQGEQPRPPRVPLVSIYPEEGTLYSDNPLIVLDAECLEPLRQRAVAHLEAGRLAHLRAEHAGAGRG